MINKCGECHVCCKVPCVPEIEKPANVLCWLYKENGCSINADKPKNCKTYQCVWVTQENIDIKYRPDILNVVFEQPLGCSFWIGYELKEDALKSADVASLIFAMNKDSAAVILKDISGNTQYSLPANMTFQELNKMYQDGMSKIKEMES